MLRRDNHECQLAGPRCARQATEVDHIDGAGDHELDNLQAVCRPCHATKTGQANAARLNASKPSRRTAPEPHPGMLE